MASSVHGVAASVNRFLLYVEETLKGALMNQSTIQVLVRWLRGKLLAISPSFLLHALSIETSDTPLIELGELDSANLFDSSSMPQTATMVFTSAILTATDAVDRAVSCLTSTIAVVSPSSDPPVPSRSTSPIPTSFWTHESFLSRVYIVFAELAPGSYDTRFSHDSALISQEFLLATIGVAVVASVAWVRKLTICTYILVIQILAPFRWYL